MTAWRTVLGVLVILTVSWDAFETILLPRRVARRLRLSSLFIRGLWRIWSGLGRRVSLERRRESFLSLFAVLALLMLLGLWAFGLILGFALIIWGPGSSLASAGGSGFAESLYVSATSFVTLGIGDVTPATSWARVLVATEAGAGLVFLALIVSYLPVLYQAFSRRESRLSTLDEWAGSPPTAVELLRRAARGDAIEDVQVVLRDWESWGAELLESHLSYPILAYFRSQHDNQSWLAALTAVLDLCSIVLVGVEGVPKAQARRTFAMMRHAAVDMSQVLQSAPRTTTADRRVGTLESLAELLGEDGPRVDVSPAARERFVKLLGGYEPYVQALAAYLVMPPPPLTPPPDPKDNWQRSPWEIYEAPAPGED